jgi:hypothetical protein
MGVSLNPDTFSKGGLIQDVDVEIIGGRYTLEPPAGYTQRDRVFAELSLKVLDDGSEVDQYWSVGKNTDFTPSSDGLELVPSGSRETLNDNSNFSIFIQNLVNVQFPKQSLTDKLDCLFGTQIHVVRIPAPEREGLEKGADAKKAYILVPNKLIKLPGEKSRARAGAKKGAASAAAPTAGAPPAATEPTMDAGEVETQALVDVTEIMGEGKALPIPLLKAQVIRRHMKTDTATRNKIVALVGDADWLATQGFTVTAGVVSPMA